MGGRLSMPGSIADQFHRPELPQEIADGTQQPSGHKANRFACTFYFVFFVYFVRRGRLVEGRTAGYPLVPFLPSHPPGPAPMSSLER